MLGMMDTALNLFFLFENDTALNLGLNDEVVGYLMMARASSYILIFIRQNLRTLQNPNTQIRNLTIETKDGDLKQNPIQEPSQKSAWVIGVGRLRHFGHAEEKTRKERGWCIKAIRPKRELKKKKRAEAKSSELYLLWFDVKSVKGRKEEKMMK